MSSPEPTPAEMEASEWLVLLDSSDVPHAEIVRFQAWLAASDENKRAWDAISRTWDRLGPILASLPAEAPDGRQADTAPLAYTHHARAIARRRGRARWAALGAIAAAAAALGLFAPLPNRPFSPEGGASHVTQARETRMLALEDGSRVELGPMGALDVAYSDAERRVLLREGAALFDVAADARRPFVVATRFGDVRVVGASLNVRVGENDTVVSVVRGTVQGATTPGPSLWARISHAPATVTARALQEIRISRDSAILTELEPALVRRRLAWRNGVVAADNITLAEAAEEVTRFSGVVFQFPDRSLARERVTLYLEGSDVEAFLSLLEANLDVRAERTSADRVVLRRQS